MARRDTSQTIAKVIDEDSLTVVKTFLERKDGKGFKTFIIDRKLSDESRYWEICSEVCVHITKDNCEIHAVFFEACEMCLSYIVTEGNPKEILLALLEQCEFFDDDVKYTILLFHVQKTLLRLPNKRFHSLDLALETFTAYIIDLPLPDDNALEIKERKLLSMCGEVVRINTLMESFLQFLKPFVEEVSLKTSKILHNENVQAQIIVLKIHLLKILNQPIIFLDVHYENDACGKNNTRMLVEKLMNLLTHLETNFQKMMEYAMKTKPLIIRLDAHFGKTDMEIENDINEKRLQDLDDIAVTKDKNNTKYPSLRFNEVIPIHSLCCLAYLIHSEKLGLDRFPCIYSNSYVFEFNLCFINEMLSSTKSLLLSKGLKLLQAFITMLPTDSLSALRLDNDYFNKVMNNLIEIMIRCSIKDLRQESLKVFTALINLFQPNGRYQIYQNILHSSEHSGIQGYVINLVKDDIKLALIENIPNKSFVGHRLDRLLNLAVTLPEGETTDLLEHSDRIITVLNLLRYLVIRDDPIQNKTGVWNNLREMDSKFFKPLRIGLDMSKAHYELEIKKMMQRKEQLPRETTQFDVSVGGVCLPPVPENRELSVIYSALNTFDLIDSLLVRLTEIIDQQKY